MRVQSFCNQHDGDEANCATQTSLGTCGTYAGGVCPEMECNGLSESACGDLSGCKFAKVAGDCDVLFQEFQSTFEAKGATAGQCCDQTWALPSADPDNPGRFDTVCTQGRVTRLNVRHIPVASGALELLSQLDALQFLELTIQRFPILFHSYYI